MRRSRTTYRRRTQRKPYRKPQRALAIARKVNVKRDTHFFTRWGAGGDSQFTITGSAINNPYIYGMSYSFSQIASSSDFINLFDMYKITHIQVRFHLRQSPESQVGALGNYPKLWYFIDHDDANPPPTLNNFREHTKCRSVVLTPSRSAVINFKPATLAMMYRTASTTGYSPKFNQWIDCNDSVVQHYGLKVAIDNFINSNYTVDVDTRFWFACKDAR